MRKNSAQQFSELINAAGLIYIIIYAMKIAGICVSFTPLPPPPCFNPRLYGKENNLIAFIIKEP